MLLSYKCKEMRRVLLSALLEEALRGSELDELKRENESLRRQNAQIIADWEVGLRGLIFFRSIKDWTSSSMKRSNWSKSSTASSRD